MQTKKSKNFKLMYSDLDNYNGLAIVFVTASPVLTNEVRRYYSELLNKIRLHFKNKYEKKLEDELSEEEKDEMENLTQMKESIEVAMK